MTEQPVTSPRLAKRRIAYGLAEMRDEHGWSQAYVAKHVGCSAGQIGMVESRDRVPGEDFLAAILRLYERENELAEYRELRRVAKQREPEWRGIDASQYVLGFDEFVSLEHAAERVDCYETRLVPGLLQTKEYAWHVVQAARSTAGSERKLDIRMRRQQILTRQENPVHLWAILEEQALDRPVGSSAVMRAQFDQLLALAERQDGNVQIQICPTSVGPHNGMSSPFTMLRFPSPRDPGLVAVETRVQTIFFEQPAQISQFAYELDHLRTIALTPNESAALIERKKQEV